MLARYSRISTSTSSTLSETMYLVPSTRKTTVSGWPSTRSTRSGLSANRSPFRRVTRITVVLLLARGGGGVARSRGRRLQLSSAWRGRALSRTGRLTPGGEAVRPARTPGIRRRRPGPPRGETGPPVRAGTEKDPAAPHHSQARGGPLRRGHGRGEVLRSALEVDQVLQHLVGAGDDAAVGLETALGDDQPGELLGQVDVGHLQRTGDEAAAPTGARLADGRLTGVVT